MCGNCHVRRLFSFLWVHHCAGCSACLFCFWLAGVLQRAHLFLSFPESSGRESNSPSVRPASRPACVPAGADCPQGRGRAPSGAPKMRFCENTKPHLFLLFSGNFVPSHKTAARAWFLPCPLLLTKCRPEAERQTDESDPTLRPTEKTRIPGAVINNIKEMRTFCKTK